MKPAPVPREPAPVPQGGAVHSGPLSQRRDAGAWRPAALAGEPVKDGDDAVGVEAAADLDD